NDILLFQWEFPLFSAYSGMPEQEVGHIVINRADIGFIPGLAYCENRPDYFLIADYIFVPTKGYRYARQIFGKDITPWTDRKPLAFWRGGTTGIPERANDWTSLPRTKLCQLATRPGILTCSMLDTVPSYSLIRQPLQRRSRARA